MYCGHSNRTAVQLQWAIPALKIDILEHPFSIIKFRIDFVHLLGTSHWPIQFSIWLQFSQMADLSGKGSVLTLKMTFRVKCMGGINPRKSFPILKYIIPLKDLGTDKEHFLRFGWSTTMPFSCAGRNECLTDL